MPSDTPIYLPSLVTVGADALVRDGLVSVTTAQALKREVCERADQGQFFGHIAYASLLARLR